MTTSEILDEAADVIGRNGWHQGDYYDFADGRPPRICPVCALGAINIACGRDPDDWSEEPQPAEVALADHLGIRAVRDRQDLTLRLGLDWNDADGRTAEQVIAALRGAAQAEREAGR